MDSEVFRSLDGYELGVIARALLENMIKRARIANEENNPDQLSEIIIPFETCEMKLLACFRAEDTAKPKAHKMTTTEKLRDLLSDAR